MTRGSMNVNLITKMLLYSMFIVAYLQEPLMAAEGAAAHEKARASELIISISEQELYSDSQELKDKLREAARQGFFYIEIPARLKPSIEEIVAYAHTFYKDETLKAAKLTRTSGYHDFEHAQFEAFFCERPHWNVYPVNIQEFAQTLVGYSLDILHKVFPLVLPQLSQVDWKKATGSLLDGLGTYFFSFNHYRPEKKMIGLLPHQDTGFITLLYINKEGLYAHMNNKQWQSIPPKPGYFVVNFGRAFEILVNDTSRLVGAWHFVQQITEKTHHGDRISVAFYADNHPDTPVMVASPEGALSMKYPSYSDYLIDYLADVKYKKVEIPKIE